MDSERDNSKIRIHLSGIDVLRAAISANFDLRDLLSDGFVEISTSEIIRVYGSPHRVSSAVRIEFDRNGKRCSLRVPGNSKENELLRCYAGSNLVNPSLSLQKFLAIYLRHSPTLYTLASVMLAFWLISFLTPAEGQFISQSCSEKCSDAVSAMVSGFLFLIPAIVIPLAISGIAFFKFLPSIKIQTVRSAITAEAVVLVMLTTVTLLYLSPRIYEKRETYRTAYLKVTGGK